MWSLIIGGAIVSLGLFNLAMTFLKPSFFDHLDELKKAYGDFNGLVGHIVMYVVLPIMGGLLFLGSEYIW